MVANEPGYARVFLVEVKCLACGREAGRIASRRLPSLGPVLFRATGTDSVQTVPDWSRMHCAACGGNLYADAVATRRLYSPVSREELEVPRRGRPPNWLIAQRQATRDADASDER
jgi:hypothetical protein